jgi:hypothetical protein
MRLNFLQRMKAPPRQDDKPAPASATEATETTSAPAGVLKWQKCVQRLLMSEGYVIQGSPEEMATGSSARMWAIDQPFRILGPATYEDALRQWRVYEAISGEKLEPPPPPSATWHYFKFGAVGTPAP